MKFILLTSVLLLSLTSCFSDKKIKSADFNVRENKKGLSLEISKNRKSAVSNLSYFFEINLEKVQSSPLYTGLSKISFKFDKAKFKSKNLTIDFEGGEVSKVLINKKEVSDFTYNGFFISISTEHFNKENVHAEIHFSKKYSLTGSGLYKFIDNSDNSTYVYTDFEPYDANQFAPLFDQPNLKASYKLKVKAPKTWTVITSVKEQLVEESGSFNSWSFPNSQKFSTYIFSMHGGPYKVWTDKVKLKSKEIPLRLFARKSLAKFVKPEFWFKITKQGFNFFEHYFSTEYPYAKYDQVIVPNFNSGAMENVAAVTFNEAYVSKEDVAPRHQRRRLANVIFHEMAHMWFGNLVTMDWWNDLWLNESFATFMAFTGLHYNTEYTESWVNFYNRTKQWAYAEDMWRTTHPIETDVPSTNEATENFDGITYGKGASSLKQLVFLIGEESFKKGLADYFKTYPEQNTIRKNFIDSLQKHTEENLSDWTKEWLQKKGLNSLSTSFTCKESKLTKVTLKQGIVSGEQIYRTHKLNLALWSKDTPLSSPSSVHEVKIKGKETNWSPKIETPCPSALFPNWDDRAFIQVNLDQKTFDFFGKNVSKIKSSLFRSQFWSIVKTMLKLGRLAPEKIAPLIKQHIKEEKDIDALSTILRLNFLDYPVFYYYKNQKKAESDQKNTAQLLKSLITSANSLDHKKILFDNWLYLSYEKNPSEALACLTKCKFNNGFNLDIDRKWSLVKALSSLKHPEAQNQIDLLFKEDSSQRSILSKLSAEARLSTDKQSLLDKSLDSKNDLSLKKRTSILRNLIPLAQRKTLFKFTEKNFFENIDNLKDLPRRVQVTFASQFTPLFCGEFSDGKMLNENTIKNSDWIFGVKKTLLKSLDKEERCLKIKEISKD